jgi:hypothetical protein
MSRRVLISSQARRGVTAAAGVSFCRIGSANDYAAAGAVQLKKLGQDYDMKEMVRFATRARGT